MSLPRSGVCYLLTCRFIVLNKFEIKNIPGNTWDPRLLKREHNCIFHCDSLLLHLLKGEEKAFTTTEKVQSLWLRFRVLPPLFFCYYLLGALPGLSTHFLAGEMTEINSLYKLFAHITLLIGVQMEKFLKKPLLHT